MTSWWTTFPARVAANRTRREAPKFGDTLLPNSGTAIFIWISPFPLRLLKRASENRASINQCDNEKESIRIPVKSKRSAKIGDRWHETLYLLKY
jgi:hypothetical protein